MQMARRFWLGMTVLALGAAACGDESDDKEYGPEIRESDAETICTAACERSAVCTDVDNPDLAPCVEACVPGLIERSKPNKCTYTSSNIRGCANAYDSFSCTELEAGNGPSACAWTCSPDSSASLAAPF
jgi:hypothetical protein